MRQVHVPVSLLLVDGDGKHLGHGVVNALSAIVGLRVVGAGGDLAHAHKLVDGRRKLGAEVVAVVRQQSSCLLYTSPSPRDGLLSRMPSSA